MRIILSSILFFSLFFTANIMAADSVYDIEFLANNHKSQIKLSDYKNKVIMIVNTASECGFTKQYAELEKLWQQYKDRDFVIIAVPSNDFFSQEPGSDEEILQFCQVNFGVTFPIAAKQIVTGKEAHPFFKKVRDDMGALSSPKWNFYKYIISPNGQIVAWFSAITSPMSPKITKVIEEQLAEIKK